MNTHRRRIGLRLAAASGLWLSLAALAGLPAGAQIPPRPDLSRPGAPVPNRPPSAVGGPAVAGPAVGGPGAQIPPRPEIPLPRPMAPTAPALPEEFAIEVRAAALGDVVRQLSAASGVPMDVEPAVAGRRITLIAARSNVEGVRRALAGLYRTVWQQAGAGPDAAYRLLQNRALDANAVRLREQRRAAFLANLLQVAGTPRARETQVAAAIQAGVARRMPALPPEALAQISPEYLRQALLLEPLRSGMFALLVRTGSAIVPLRALPPAYQTVMADYFLAEMGGAGLAADASSAAEAREVLAAPQARVDYRLLYGDRWTGTLLLVRVGMPDHWAMATLSSELFDLPDDTAMYPEIAQRPVDTESFQPVGVRIDPGTQTWEQALSTISRATGINIMSDAYLRPDVFRPRGPAAPLMGGTLAELLDRVAGYYGFVWWKQGDWFLFRSRNWADEERVAVPERVLASLGESLNATPSLGTAGVGLLAALTDEQLLTMNLYAAAAGGVTAPATAFDFDEIQVARSGLSLYGQMAEPERQLADGPGVPFLMMTPQQQYLFTAVGYERGMPLELGDRDAWRLRVAQQFRRQKQVVGWAHVGSVQIELDYGAGGSRAAVLGVRAPARDPAPAPLPAAP